VDAARLRDYSKAMNEDLNDFVVMWRSEAELWEKVCSEPPGEAPAKHKGPTEGKWTYTGTGGGTGEGIRYNKEQPASMGNPSRSLDTLTSSLMTTPASRTGTLQCSMLGEAETGTNAVGVALKMSSMLVASSMRTWAATLGHLVQIATFSADLLRKLQDEKP
jgi:hypothetical protein